MLQTQAVKYFMEVAHSGSLRQASLALQVAPSAISRQVRLLEEQIGTPIFARTANGMDLTPAGEVVLQFVKTHHANIDQLKADLADLSSLERGTVYLAVVEAATNELLPKLINSFAEKHPNIQFHVSAVGSIDVADKVARKEADLGIPFNVQSRDDLKLLARVRQPLRVVFRPNHRLSTKGTLTIEDIRNEHLAVPEPSFGIRQLVENSARNAGVHLNIRRVANSLQLLKSLVRTTDLVTFLPSSAFVVEESKGILVSAALEDPLCSQATLDIICSRTHPLSAAARAFLKHVLEHIRQ